MDDQGKGTNTQTAPSLPPYNFDTSRSSTNSRTDHSQQSNAPKSWKIMKGLVVAELILAIISIIFGIACIGTSVGTNYPIGVCYDGSAIWVGVLCIVTAYFGIRALKIPSGRQRFLTAHFVLLIISCVGCGILLILSGIWIDDCRYYSYGSLYGPYVALFIFNIILLLVSLTLFTLFTLSASLVCYTYNWCDCCKGQEPAYY